MGKIILFIASSLDGFIATNSGEVDWLFTDEDYGYTDFFASIDTVLMGRKTYDQILQFTPYPYPGKKGFVFTQTKSINHDENVVFIKDNLPQFMIYLHNLPKNIWLVGGGEIINIFLQNNWIDEIILSIHPVILGNGIPLFIPTQKLPQWWTLQHTQTFPSGLVQLSYVNHQH